MADTDFSSAPKDCRTAQNPKSTIFLAVSTELLGAFYHAMAALEQVGIFDPLMMQTLNR